MIPPRAIYRLQLHAGFDFHAPAGILDYPRDLGVSHSYCSPRLQAAPGSQHGYDVVIPHCCELGWELTIHDRDKEAIREPLAWNIDGITGCDFRNLAGGPRPGDTHPDVPEGRWTHQLAGETVEGGRIDIGSILRVLPAALLTRESAA